MIASEASCFENFFSLLNYADWKKFLQQQDKEGYVCNTHSHFARHTHMGV